MFLFFAGQVSITTVKKLDPNSEINGSAYLTPNKNFMATHKESCQEVQQNSGVLSNTTHSFYNHIQFLPSHQYLGSRPSVQHTYCSSSRNSIDLSSFKNTSLPINSINKVNNSGLCLSINAPAQTHLPLSTSFIHQNIPEMPYGQISTQLFWNKNLMQSHTGSVSDGLLTYTTPLASFLDPKFSFPINSAQNSNVDLSYSSNCSDTNSEFDSIEVIEHDKKSLNLSKTNINTLSVLKKRNPYSIEELLKKPDKKPFSFQIITRDNIKELPFNEMEVSNRIKNNQISIEVSE